MRYNTTSLRPSVRSLVIDRDYLAHVLKWSYVVRCIERRRALDPRRPYHVADVGCGVEAPLAAVIAGHAYLARGRPLAYYGVDVGPIRPLASPAWATFLPFTDALLWEPPVLMDLVACLEVIEHMPRDDGLRLLRRLRSIVRPDGTVLLATPVRARTLPRNHVYEWGLDELLEEVASAGLVVERIFGTFMDVNVASTLASRSPGLREAWDLLSAYYNSEVLSCLMSPLFPEASKSVLLVLRPGASR